MSRVEDIKEHMFNTILIFLNIKMAEALLPLLVVIGMGRGGYNAYNSQTNIDNSVQDLVAKTEAFTKTAKEAFANCQAEDADIQSKIGDMWEDIAQTSAKIIIMKKDFNTQFYELSYYGIAFIISIFFLMLLKRLNILSLNPLGDMK